MSEPNKADLEKAVLAREIINSMLGMNVLKEMETAVIATALAEQREADAKIAEKADYGSGEALGIAAAIREGGE